MKTRQKGSAYELEVQKILEADGWTIHRARASNFKVGNKVLCRSNDIFNIVDIIAKKEGESTCWIQVSTGTRRAEKEKKLLSIPNIWNEYDNVSLWLRFPRKEWKIYELHNGKLEETGRIIRGKHYEVKENTA